MGLGDHDVQWMLKRHQLAELHKFLWNKKDGLNNQILRTVEVECAMHEFPGKTFERRIESWPSPNEGKRIYKFKILSLAKLSCGPGLMQEDVEGWHAGLATQNGYRYLLSGICASATEEVLVRPCYEEMLDIIEDMDNSRLGRPVRRMGVGGRMQFIKERSIRLNEEKAFLITGQSGIGKSWFLAYVLVMRLLQGKPTIAQLENNGGDGYAHVFVDERGARLISDADFMSSEFRNNSDIWCLCDEKSKGFLRNYDLHNWLILVPSSSSLYNFRSVNKTFGFNHLVMGLWSWPEISARCLMDVPLLKDPHQFPAWRDKCCMLFHKYGASPRRVFRYLAPAQEQHKPNCSDLIRLYDVYVTKRIWTALREHTHKYQFTEEDDHALVAIHAMTDVYAFNGDPNRKMIWNSRSSFVTVASEYIAEKIQTEIKLRARQKAMFAASGEALRDPDVRLVVGPEGREVPAGDIRAPQLQGQKKQGLL